MMHVEPVTLQGHLVRLEPLRMEHTSQIYEASQDPSLWTYKPVKQPHPHPFFHRMSLSCICKKASARATLLHIVVHASQTFLVASA